MHFWGWLNIFTSVHSKLIKLNFNHLLNELVYYLLSLITQVVLEEAIHKNVCKIYFVFLSLFGFI